ncbi:unnamed protein product [Amoebophrya sp. A120]|nr:unnamed protein product [Amoebophrya sp. A120]|eukprot:GSA120T00001396001.1
MSGSFGENKELRYEGALTQVKLDDPSEQQASGTGVLAPDDLALAQAAFASGLDGFGSSSSSGYGYFYGAGGHTSSGSAGGTAHDLEHNWHAQAEANLIVPAFPFPTKLQSDILTYQDEYMAELKKMDFADLLSEIVESGRIDSTLPYLYADSDTNPSRLWCVLLRFSLLPLNREQLDLLLHHSSGMAKAAGILYARLVFPPEDFYALTAPSLLFDLDLVEKQVTGLEHAGATTGAQNDKDFGKGGGEDDQGVDEKIDDDDSTPLHQVNSSSSSASEGDHVNTNGATAAAPKKSFNKMSGGGSSNRNNTTSKPAATFKTTAAATTSLKSHKKHHRAVVLSDEDSDASSDDSSDDSDEDGEDSALTVGEFLEEILFQSCVVTGDDDEYARVLPRYPAPLRRKMLPKLIDMKHIRRRLYMNAQISDEFLATSKSISDLKKEREKATLRSSSPSSVSSISSNKSEGDHVGRQDEKDHGRREQLLQDFLDDQKLSNRAPTMEFCLGVSLHWSDLHTADNACWFSTADFEIRSISEETGFAQVRFPWSEALEKQLAQFEKRAEEIAAAEQELLLQQGQGGHQRDKNFANGGGAPASAGDRDPASSSKPNPDSASSASAPLRQKLVVRQHTTAALESNPFAVFEHNDDNLPAGGKNEKQDHKSKNLPESIDYSIFLGLLVLLQKGSVAEHDFLSEDEEDTGRYIYDWSRNRGYGAEDLRRKAGYLLRQSAVADSKQGIRRGATVNISSHRRKDHKGPSLAYAASNKYHRKHLEEEEQAAEKRKLEIEIARQEREKRQQRQDALASKYGGRGSPKRRKPNEEDNEIVF